MKDKGNNRPNKHPITTVTQCRVPIFWPTNKPPRAKGVHNLVIENSYGKATIENCKLTQVHRNLLDVILAYHHGLYFYQDGAAGFLVDLYEVQNILQIYASNHTWVLKKLKDMMTTVFEVETKEWMITGAIVRKHNYSKEDAEHTPDKFGENKLYYIILEAQFMEFFKLDTNVLYFEFVEKIINLKSAICQALVRFCLSHRQLNQDLEEVLKQIGVLRKDTHKREKSRILQEIFLESEALINEFGIQITPMKNKRLGIFYTQTKGVWFTKPKDLPQD